MKLLATLTLPILFLACSHATDNSPAQVQLTSDRIALSVADTSNAVDASLNCGCPCLLQNMVVSGDTSIICFNLDQHKTAQATHHIVATARQTAAKSGVLYTCTLSFVMHESMMMGGMQDYQANVTATFSK